MRFQKFLHDQFPKILKKKSNKATNIDSVSNDKISTTISTTFKISKTVPKKQATFNSYISCPLSEKDKPYFENLLLYMIILNRLSFTFMENHEMQNVFNFIVPALKLPNQQALKESTETFLYATTNNKESNLLASDNSTTQSSKTFEVTDKDIIDDTETFNEEHWSHMIKNWVNTLNNKDSDEIANNELFKVELGECTTHSADNLLVK
ncbi:14452_t:CDS:2 [Cetraspora pellucida]|uniref:14452_t:CDS:1 n=1 Tax=Cetraspora pellucida TaxID=1433469 RepID=A0A9N9DVG0_9GLOM|nr:14452_t:CDS:2 [Cetraspora pellucida]